MFNYLTEEKHLIACDDRDILRTHFYEFSLEKDDYFLQRKVLWDSVVTNFYEFCFGDGTTISIPSNYYVLIADVYGEVDWICVDELINRPIEVLILNDSLSSWTLEVLEVTGMTKPKPFYWSATKNAVPVTNSNGKKVIILSTYDQYKATMDLDISSFVG